MNEKEKLIEEQLRYMYDCAEEIAGDTTIPEFIIYRLRMMTPYLRETEGGKRMVREWYTDEYGYLLVDDLIFDIISDIVLRENSEGETIITNCTMIGPLEEEEEIVPWAYTLSGRRYGEDEIKKLLAEIEEEMFADDMEEYDDEPGDIY